MKKLEPKQFSYTTTNYNTSIWPIIMLVEMLGFYFYQIIGQNFGSFVGEWKNRTNSWVSQDKIFDQIAIKTLSKIKKDKTWLKKSMQKLDKLCQDLIKFTTNIYQSNLKEKSDQKLYQFYTQYREKFLNMYLYGWIPNALEGHNNLFSKKLKKYLEKKLIKLKKQNQLGEYFSVLTTLPKTTVREQEQIDFLKILTKIKKIIKSKFDILSSFRALARNLPTCLGNNPAFAGDSSSDIRRSQNDNLNKIKKLFTIHTQKYCWLPFDYEGKPWDENYFIETAKSFIKQNIDPNKELEKIKKEKVNLIKKQEEYGQEINLTKDKEYAYLFQVAQELMWWKNERKDILYKSYYHMDKLINEIAKRLQLTPTQVRHILPDEMKKALLDKKYAPHLLNKRIKHSIVILANKKINIYTGGKANILSDKFFEKKKINKDIKQFFGETTFSGKVKGKVKIINNMKDIIKMKKGNILVSEKTVPALLPAMKKAAAIVTDQGGITCHAAIVSREMRKPCIIGTKIATKVLHDGDLIEVDANKGIIKKL